MKINNSEGGLLSGLGRSGGAGTASPAAGSSASAGPSLGADRIQLSNLSANLTAELGDSAAQLKKLSALSAMALSGRYRVDAGAVSDSIIRDSLQFGGANYTFKWVGT
jgi:anti-sigma28 factor (negative regulator of flagellin synthesis)